MRTDQKTVIVPAPIHDQLAQLQQEYRAELGRTVTFGEIIERAIHLLTAMRSDRDPAMTCEQRCQTPFGWAASCIRDAGHDGQHESADFYWLPGAEMASMKGRPA